MNTAASKIARAAGGLLLGATLLLGCVPAPSATPGPQSSVPLRDCRLSSPGFPVQYAARCAELEVFENREAQSGRKIKLHLAVLPSSSQNKASDAVFLLAGGPGQAATEAFVPMISSLDRVRFKHDIVMVDQRGTGQSNPLRCSNPDEAGAEMDSDKTTEQQLAELGQCLGKLDADPRFYTTDIAMQDLDHVRQALGYNQIDLIGVSYGTRAALTYLRLFPNSTRAVVLDSVAPVGWTLGDTVAGDAQRALDEMTKRCQSDKDCKAAFPDSSQELSDLLNQLDKNPAQVEVANPTTGKLEQVKLTRMAAMTTVRMMLYSTETTALLPLVIHQAAQGDLKPLAAQYLIVFQSLSESMADGMYLSVLCSEDAPFYTNVSGNTGSFSFDKELVQKQCQVWPHDVQSPEERQPVASSAPVLLLRGAADPVTPPAYAESAAKSLSNSLNIILPGMGHNNMYRGCMPKIIADFIDSGKIAGLDTSCASASVQPDPFFLSNVGPKP